MKRNVLLAVLLLSGALGAYAQTKGTNSVGLGVDTYKSKYDFVGGSSGENKNSNYSLRYAHFVKDNVKLGIGFSYANTVQSENTEANVYGGSFLYQKYFPVYKKLYVFVGGEANYSRIKADNFNYVNGIVVEKTELRGNSYSLGVYGGASYFLGKHWELETRILSANAGYSSSKNNTIGYETTSSNFSLRTGGAFTNLGFSINFLF